MFATVIEWTYKRHDLIKIWVRSQFVILLILMLDFFFFVTFKHITIMINLSMERYSYKYLLLTVGKRFWKVTLTFDTISRVLSFGKKKCCLYQNKSMLVFDENTQSYFCFNILLLTIFIYLKKKNNNTIELSMVKNYSW